MERDADISKNLANMTNIIIVATDSVIEMKPSLLKKVFNVFEGPIVNTPGH